ncbi:MAG TPA: ABC transporter substrate-binding protein [Steroidobacteraceae bacterium]|nr:ABC transporter substrate-binding protein [Steroidobacteraceae bacterium]
MQLDQLKRRDFITLLGSTAAAWPFGARAQQFAGVKRLGVLMSVRENDPEGKAQLSGFMEALAALGWISDRNLRMDIRWGGGDVSRTRTFAKELVALQPDVILTQGTPGTAALQPETRTIPIVFVVVADPVGPGFVSSLSRPGGNITGFINSEASLGAKMLELLTEIAPRLKRVAMIFNSDTAPGRGTYYFREFEAAARSSKLEPIAADASSDAEIETVVTSLRGEPRGGVVVTPDYFMFNHTQQITSQAARHNVPTIYPWKSTVISQGGLLSYGPDLVDIVRRSAPYVDKILRGANPADLPVQVPVRFEVAVNVKTARILGLTVPTSIVVRADNVVE